MSSIDLTREPLITLNKDGVSDEFFKLLWSKDEMNFSPLINLPDTIVYKYGQPTAWYFTSNNGHIKKKNRFNLVSSKIEDAFNRHPLGYDVVAYFITMPSEYELNHPNNVNNNTVAPTIIEYLDREGLNKFLYNHKKDTNGILQKFLDPKTTRQEVIRAVWSPKLILLERAENIHDLHDKRYGLYEKCVTYEGPDYYYRTSPLRGPVLSGQIQRTVEAAVAHINEVTFGQKQVSRIVLTFKIDSREKLWLLYSTSIRCQDMMELLPLGADNPNGLASTQSKNLLNIDKVVSLSSKVTLNPFKSYQFTGEESRLPSKPLFPCISCNAETTAELRHNVTYKSIIKHYDHVLALLQSSTSLRHHNRKEGTIAWPPDREIVMAAGGVGFCGLLVPDKPDVTVDLDKKLEYNRSRRRVDNLRYKAIKDVQIPPIISSLHPKLTTETYHRCKDDPLFYNKTVQVCESCYLVYAEFTSMLLTIGENIHKLLAPVTTGRASLRSRTASPIKQTSTTTSTTVGGGGGGGGGNRPTSADWRAISQSANNSLQFSPSHPMFQSSILSSSLSEEAMQHHLEAKQRSIGLRSDDWRQQPPLPHVVRSGLDTASVAGLNHNQSMASLGGLHDNSVMSPSTSVYRTGGMLETDSFYHHNNTSQPQRQQTTSRGGIGMTGSEEKLGPRSFQYDSEEVQAMIADRERRFFKEISLNPQLKDSHPLQHLISTQQKLKLVDEQSGILMSNKSTAKPALFGDQQYGRQANSHHAAKYGAYSQEIPYIIAGEIILPSELKKRKQQKTQLKKLQKQRTLASFLVENEEEGAMRRGEQLKQTATTTTTTTTATTTMAASTVSSSTILKSQTTPDLQQVLKVVEAHTKPLEPVVVTKETKKEPKVIDEHIKNSKQYRHFLAESLKRIEDDVQAVVTTNNTTTNNNTNTHSKPPSSQKHKLKTTSTVVSTATNSTLPTPTRANFPTTTNPLPTPSSTNQTITSSTSSNNTNTASTVSPKPVDKKKSKSKDSTTVAKEDPSTTTSAQSTASVVSPKLTEKKKKPIKPSITTTASSSSNNSPESIKPEKSIKSEESMSIISPVKEMESLDTLVVPEANVSLTEIYPEEKDPLPEVVNPAAAAVPRPLSAKEVTELTAHDLATSFTDLVVNEAILHSIDENESREKQAQERALVVEKEKEVRTMRELAKSFTELVVNEALFHSMDENESKIARDQDREISLDVVVNNEGEEEVVE